MTDKRTYRRNVAAFIIDGKGKVLACERRDRPGAWQLPQGGVETGESDEVALFREIQEEIGCGDLELIALSQTCYRYDFPDWLSNTPIAQAFRGQEQRFGVLRFLPGGCPDITQADHEFRDFAWMEPQSLIDQLVEFKRKACQAAYEELRMAIEVT